MMIVLPISIRASIILSGMFGLQFEGKSDGKWNRSFMITTFPNKNPKPEITTTHPPIHSTSPGHISTSPAISTSTSTEQTSVINQGNHTELEMMGSHAIRCGPSFCKSGEICVTWMKEKNENNNTRKSRESPVMSHQCLLDDGKHYNKMDPIGIMLCEDGQAHSIIRHNQPCLKHKPPCPLVWKYKCSSNPVDVHTCKFFKDCESCVESIECDFSPPCVTKAVCLQDRLDHGA